MGCNSLNQLLSITPNRPIAPRTQAVVQPSTNSGNTGMPVITAIIFPLIMTCSFAILAPIAAIAAWWTGSGAAAHKVARLWADCVLIPSGVKVHVTGSEFHSLGEMSEKACCLNIFLKEKMGIAATIIFTPRILAPSAVDGKIWRSCQSSRQKYPVRCGSNALHIM